MFDPEFRYRRKRDSVGQAAGQVRLGLAYDEDLFKLVVTVFGARYRKIRVSDGA